MNHYDRIIIGAGMAGLAAGQRLGMASTSFLIVDKGRGFGGRVATRRMGEARVDHGAACFRREGEALAWIQGSKEKDLGLSPAPVELEKDAWTLNHGMNALAKAMAQGLPIQLQTTVSHLHYEDGFWLVSTQEGTSWKAPEVLLTCPLWQSAEFFAKSDASLDSQLKDLAAQVAYEARWVLIVKAQHAGETYQRDPHPDIASIYDQCAKGLPHAAGYFVIQASPEFSLLHREAQPEEIQQRLGHALKELGWTLDGAEMQAHRWRYAFVKKPFGQAFYTLKKAPGLVLAGDFCLGSSVHLAAASGRAAAEFMLKAGK